MQSKAFVSLTTLALCLFTMQTVSAADLPRGPAVSAPVMAPPAVNPWTGFYFGGNVGYSAGRVENSTSSTVLSGSNAGLTSTTDTERSLTGVIGGGQIGWNWNLAPNWIWGVEADFQGSDQKSNGSSISLDNVTPTTGALAGITTTQTTTVTAEQKLDWFGTVRGRVGWMMGNTLWYGTGGYAYGRVEATNSTTRLPAIPGTGGSISLAGAGTATATKSGWAAGLGAESKLWGNWTWRLEYLFVDLGTLTNAYNVLATSGSTSGNAASHFVATSKFQDHIFRVGLNYRL
jgi:outer membrane immunogenic protein